MRTGSLLAVAFASAIAFAVPARAGTISYDSYTVVPNNQIVTLQPGGERGYSGEIILNLTGGGTLGVWCDDLADNLQSSGVFTASVLPAGPIADAINALITNGTPFGSDTDAAAALQIAMWRIEFPASTITPDNTSIGTLASTYIEDVTGGTWKPDPTMQVIQLSEVGNQSQVHLAAVPEPASMAVMGIAIGMLGFVTRRRAII